MFLNIPRMFCGRNGLLCGHVTLPIPFHSLQVSLDNTNPTTAQSNGRKHKRREDEGPSEVQDKLVVQQQRWARDVFEGDRPRPEQAEIEMRNEATCTKGKGEREGERQLNDDTLRNGGLLILKIHSTTYKHEQTPKLGMKARTGSETYERTSKSTTQHHG